MPSKNRTSITLSDSEKKTLDRIALHTQKSRAQVIRLIIREYLEQNPDRFNLLKHGSRLLDKKK